MKKYKLLILGCGLLLTSFTLKNEISNSKQDLIFSCEEKNVELDKIDVKKAKTNDEAKVGKTYMQTGVYNKKRMLRFATPVYGDFNSLNYFVSIEGYNSVVNKEVNIVYKGIDTNGTISYFDGTNIVNEKTELTSSWYWACFTIEFSTYKFYTANISAYLTAKTSSEEINSEAKENICLKQELLSNEIIDKISSNLLGNYQTTDNEKLVLNEDSLTLNEETLTYIDKDEDYFIFHKNDNVLKVKFDNNSLIVDGTINNKKYEQVNFTKEVSTKTFDVTFKYKDQVLGVEKVEEGNKPNLKTITRPVNDNLTFYGWEIDGKVYLEDNLPVINKDTILNAIFKAKILVNTYNNQTNELMSQKEHYYDENEMYTLNFETINGLVPNKDYIKAVANKNTTENIYYSPLSKWDGTSEELTLLEKNHYTISTSAQFAYFANQVNSGVSYEGCTITLTSSLEINSDFVNIGDVDNSFKGIFDGNNNSIRGINKKSTATRTALFYELTNGTIKNLSTYGSVEAGQYGSVLVGRNMGGTIDNVTNYATLSHSTGNGAGAIAGGLNNGGTITNCVNYGNVTGSASNNKTAGIVGALEGTKVNTINYCKNFGEIKGATLVGGIAGEVYASKSKCGIFNSENYGNVRSLLDTYVEGITGKVGGIVGQFTSSTKATSVTYMSNVINYGNVTGSSVVNSGVGGIVGEYNIKTTIENAINYGEVFGNNRTGGIAGNLYGKINNSINYGVVQAGYSESSVKDKGKYVGGIAAVCFDGSSISNSKNCGSVLSNNAYIGGIFGASSSGKPTITITSCDNYGDVYTTANGAGGIVGGSLNKTAIIKITSSNNYGNITANNKVGGIAGSIPLSFSTVEDSTNYGTIEATAKSGTIYSGDLVGQNLG